MAAGERGQSIDKTSEWEEFTEKLRKFHEARGTNFDPEPKIGQRRVNLLAMFGRVMKDGGYDKVSDKKLMPLQWKKIGDDLGLGKATHASALAFQMKTVYYRFLAAYEIKTVHNKEPPPKEILEDVSARGGDLLNRTVENYPLARPVEEEDGDGTPNADKMDVDDPGSGRAMRAGLRQAPPQRQLFQADPASTYRQTRNQGQHSSSPNPANFNGLGHLHNATAAQALANYEPRPAFPLTLRPVTTPSSHPDQFKATQAAIRDAHIARLSGRPPGPPKINIMLPGTGFPGPNIYSRTWMALKSGIPEEQEYALHHLVKISHERGDKYRFDQFGGLVEAMTDILLDTTSLFYDTTWRISFDDYQQNYGTDVLDALHGTSDIISRLRHAQPRKARDKIETSDINQKLRLINEAGLVIRNLCMLDENAQYALKYPPFSDALTIILNLPDEPSMIEIKHYALEISEQLTKHMRPDDNLQFLSTLMDATFSPDRGVILSSLRAISRTSTRKDVIMPLPDCPLDMIQRLCEWLLVEDLDLRSAVLDFFYRYTASVENVELMLQHLDLTSFVRQLTRLLQFGARQEEYQVELPDPHAQPRQAPPPPPGPSDQSSIPKISQDHIDLLLTYDEPDRSSQWLRGCFYEDPTGEITQIALWQAYQIPFTPHSTTRPLLPAKDFITNVSTTFAHASAQVINMDGAPKFIIKGIRPREVPVDPKGKPFMKCRWVLSEDDSSASIKAGEECKQFAGTGQKMWEHLMSSHMRMSKNEEGKFDPAAAPLDAPATCRWANCSRLGAESKPAVANGIPSAATNAAPRAEGIANVPNPSAVDQPPSAPTTNGDTSMDIDPPSTSDDHIPTTNGAQTDPPPTSAPTPTPSSYVDKQIIFNLGLHLKTHLPDNHNTTTNNHNHRSKPTTLNSPSSKSSSVAPSTTQGPQTHHQQHHQHHQQRTRTITTLPTPADETNHATGLPLTACLVLRNLARNIPKTRFQAERREDGDSRHHGEIRDSDRRERESRGGEGRGSVRGSLVHSLFAGVKAQLYFCLAHNRPLGDALSGLLRLVEAEEE